MATALIGSQSLGTGPWLGRLPSREAAGKKTLRRGRRWRLLPEERERLLTAHLPQVLSIASRLHRRLPAQTEREDLFHAGVVGLIEAVDHYDRRKNDRFSAFAEFRIRGAILDSLRDLDWGPRRLRRCGRQLDAAKESLARRLGRPAEEHEVARAAGLAIEEYRRLTAELGGLRLGRLGEEASGDGRKFLEPRAEGRDPFELCLQSEIGAIVASAAAGLSERERRVLALYYREELTMKEVAGEMGVAESRVCQLHAAALGKIRLRLNQDHPGRRAAARNTPA